MTSKDGLILIEGTDRTLVLLSRDPEQHRQIVLLTDRPENLTFNVIKQISVRADRLESLQGVFAHLHELKVAELVGITHGNEFSVYLNGPEGNRIELYLDSPWYVSQPCRFEAPLHLPAGEFLAWAETDARTLPGFRSRAGWRAEMVQRMERDAT